MFSSNRSWSEGNLWNAIHSNQVSDHKDTKDDARECRQLREMRNTVGNKNEKFTKGIEIIKHNWTEILEVKTSNNEIKIKLRGISAE